MQKKGRLPVQEFKSQPYVRFKALSPIVEQAVKKAEEKAAKQQFRTFGTPLVHIGDKLVF